MAKKQKKQTNNNEYPIVFNLVPPVGNGDRDVSYLVWSALTKCAIKERAIKIEVGIWGAYVLGSLVEGISLKDQATLFRDINDEGNAVLEFNPECCTKIRFDGRDLIELIPSYEDLALIDIIPLSKSSNKKNKINPVKFDIHPHIGFGTRAISYTLWERIMSRVSRLNYTEIEVGIWGAYTLGHIVEGISLMTPIVIAKNGYGDDVTLTFNPSCGKMVKFNGTDLIELIPGETEEIEFR